MAEFSFVSVRQSGRKSNSYLLARDDPQAAAVGNENRLDAELADCNRAGSKLSENMGRFRRNEGDDAVRKYHVIAAFVGRAHAVCVNAGGHIYGDDCSESVIDGFHGFHSNTG